MKISVVILLVIVLSSFQIAVTSTIDFNVMRAADGQLDVFTGKIPPGEASSYGFRQEDDMDLLKVGKPYRVIEFTKSFYEDSAPREDKNYINIENEWRAPVSYKEQARVMLTVKGNSGNYSVTSMGDSALAKELQHASRGVSDSDEYYLLRIPSLSADFFVHEADNSFNDAVFIPLKSAIKAIPELGNPYTGSFTLDEVQQKVKEALMKRTDKEQPLKQQPNKKKTRRKPKKKTTGKSPAAKAK